MIDVSEHKFKIGQAVEYYPPRGLYAPRGAYIVTATLPPNRFGEFEYKVKHLAEQHERVAMERNLNAL